MSLMPDENKILKTKNEYLETKNGILEGAIKKLSMTIKYLVKDRGGRVEIPFLSEAEMDVLSFETELDEERKVFVITVR